MKNKHTPGPWYSNEKGIFAHNGGTLISENLAVKWEALAVLQVNKKNIAEIQKNIDLANANTKLIAAAPEMFDALQAITDAFGDRDSLLINQCKAAMKKAMGQI